MVTVQPEVYDPTSDTWTATPPLDLCCNEFLSPPITLADGRVLAGGRLFDPTSWTWSVVSSPPYGSALILGDGRVFEWPGGLNGPGPCSESPILYDPATDTEQTIDTAGVCLDGPSMFQLPDGSVLVHGDCEPEQYAAAGTGAFWLLDPATRVLSYASTTASTCAGDGSAALPDGEAIYLGYVGTTTFPYVPIVSGKVARFDSIDRVATELAPLPTPMLVEGSVLRVGDKIVVVAGDPQNGVETETLSYDPTTNRWSNLAFWPGSFPQASIVLGDGSLLAADSQDFFRMTPPGVTTPIPAATYVPLPPARVLDTRFGNGLSSPFNSGLARTFQVNGRGGVPSNAVAITGNLTVTGQTSSGYVSLGPVATNAPTSSTVNFPRGDNRANGVTVPLGAGGSLSATFIGTHGAKTALVLDVTGYFVPNGTGSTYLPVTPARVFDTRQGIGPVSTNVATTFPVATLGGVPSNAIAVTGNLTVTGQTSAGYVSLTPDPTDAPTSSNLNFPLGDTRANGVTVELGSGGSLSATFIGALGSTTQLIFDVTGYFVPDASGNRYYSIPPVRLLDSRIHYNQAGSLATATAEPFQVAGSMVPLSAVSVTGNLTVTGQTSAGYVALEPVAVDPPVTSTLNFPVGDNRANGVAVALGANGTLSATFVGSLGAKAQLIFDATGYFAP